MIKKNTSKSSQGAGHKHSEDLNPIGPFGLKTPRVNRSRAKSKINAGITAADIGFSQFSLYDNKFLSAMSRSSRIQSKCLYLVETRGFFVFITTVILLNTLILALQTYDDIKRPTQFTFMIIDSIFIGIYVYEAIIKIYVWRDRYFSDAWNILDFLIVLVNGVDFLLPIIKGAVSGIKGTAIFRFFRLFRAFKALRVLRTIRMFGSLQVIMSTCFQSMQSMGAIVLLMFLFLYNFAVIGRGLYAKAAPGYFGHLGHSMLTLFQLLTLDDWFLIYEKAIAKDPNSWHIFIFLVFYITIEYFILLNLFTAVLVDNFQQALKEQLERSKDLKRLDFRDKREDDDQAKFTKRQQEGQKEMNKGIDDYYLDLTISAQEKLLIAQYLRLTAALEPNFHLFSDLHSILDRLITITNNNDSNMAQNI